MHAPSDRDLRRLKSLKKKQALPPSSILRLLHLKWSTLLT